MYKCFSEGIPWSSVTGRTEIPLDRVVQWSTEFWVTHNHAPELYSSYYYWTLCILINIFMYIMTAQPSLGSWLVLFYSILQILRLFLWDDMEYLYFYKFICGTTELLRRKVQVLMSFVNLKHVVLTHIGLLAADSVLFRWIMGNTLQLWTNYEK